MKGGKERLTNKKGLSNIIATVLIILLALAAVVIVWSFVRPTLENAGGGIDSARACLNTEIKPTGCVTFSNAVGINFTNVTYQLTKGEADSVTVLIEGSSGNSEVNGSYNSPGQVLGSEIAELRLSSTSSDEEHSAKVAAVVNDNEANPITCEPSTVVVNCGDERVSP